MTEKNYPKNLLLFLFITSIFAVIFSLTFDLTLVSNKAILNEGSKYTFWHWITFYTHLSLLLVLTWSGVELIVYYFKLDWNLHYFRLIAFTWIITTGTVYFIPLIIQVSNDLWIIFTSKTLDSYTGLNISEDIYAILSIINNIAPHFILPWTIVYLIYRYGLLNGNKYETIKEKTTLTIICSISLIIYYVWILLTVVILGIEAPYKIVFNYLSYDSAWDWIISILLTLFAVIIYVTITFLIVYHDHRLWVKQKEKYV